MPKIYRVGGCVRDKLLGVRTKDIDYTFVLDDLTQDTDEGYIGMREYLRDNGYEIFQETAKNFTIRARFPKDHIHKNLTADFVMARKELGYLPGTRQPILVLGTLEDDLVRRDFTVNAMAEDEEGNLIDLFEGQKHLAEMILITPQNVDDTFHEDPLRILRAIRFSITRGFKINTLMDFTIKEFSYNPRMKVVSSERIRDELLKCFKFDTPATLRMLSRYSELNFYIFNHTNIWLKPTFEQ